MQVQDFDYELPEEFIAQTPVEPRDASRLLVVNPDTQTYSNHTFRELTQFLQSGDVLVFNDSRVLPARLYGVKSDTGARVELLLTRPRDTYTWEVMARPAKRLKIGSELTFTAASDGEVVGTAIVKDILPEGLRLVEFKLSNEQQEMESFLEEVGTMPLPPYIHEKLQDPSRYQTVYARLSGSVAAPTAGLHFTEGLLKSLQTAGIETTFVTLHVGLGTFKPVAVDDIHKHHMHTEPYVVSEEAAEKIQKAKREGRRVIAVGTTALRTLESATDEQGILHPGQRDTDIFIYPGYKFRMVDALITNFHLPKSTLLMLIAALMGTDFMKKVYEHAVQERYRFFSFGDAMFITRRVES